MRKSFFAAIAALSFILTAQARADQGPPQQPPAVNVPDDQDQGDYQYPAPEQYPQSQPNIVIENNNYVGGRNDGQFYTPGWGGIPQNFQCGQCQVLQQGYGLFVVVATDYYSGGFYALAPPVPGGAYLISLVNSIKTQTGMCQNLPFLPPPPPVWGPGYRPLPPPVYRPGWGGGGRPPVWGGGRPPVWGGGRPGWGVRPPRPTPYRGQIR